MEDFDKIVAFVYRDKLFSCISNYAYSQFQRIMGSIANKGGGAGAGAVSGVVGGSNDMIKVARKWILLEERVREQI